MSWAVAWLLVNVTVMPVRAVSRYAHDACTEPFTPPVSAKFRMMKSFQVNAAPLLVTVAVVAVDALASMPMQAIRMALLGGLNVEVVMVATLDELVARAGDDASTTTPTGYGPAVICNARTSSMVDRPRCLSWFAVMLVVPAGTVNALSVVSGVPSAPSPM